MPSMRLWVSLLAFAGTVFGFVLAYRWPSAPLLAYWLLLGVVLGLSVAIPSPFSGVQRRLKWQFSIFAVLICSSLITTQIAARRAISSTHLLYRGVHLVGVDSFTVGSGVPDLDVHLETVSFGQMPWMMRVRRSESGWQMEPLSGIEQLRVRHGSTQPIEDEFNVARSAVLRSGGSVAVLGPDGGVVDTLRIDVGGLKTSGGSALRFEPLDRTREARYQRGLLSGTALSNLDGTRSNSSAGYERFVRIQKVSAHDAVNGEALSPFERVLPLYQRYLVSAAPPYRLQGDAVAEEAQSVSDSAFVEVRNGEATWRFALLADFRRKPGAPRGVAILFRRYPKPMDTPLPVGLSCHRGAACGAISLRRLPPPVPHIALDHAGFDPERFGLLGMLRSAEKGYEVVLPRETYRVVQGTQRPIAVPVTPLAREVADRATETEGQARWILLSAAGGHDDILKVGLIAAGLALLLAFLYVAVRTVTIRGSARLTLPQERAIASGLTALLGLVLTRVTMGARVGFFDPFLERGIQTAVGLCIAIVVVVLGLLTWPAWLPPFMAGARSVLAGQASFRHTFRAMGHWVARLVRMAAKPEAAWMAGLGVVSLLLLTWQSGRAPWQGLLTGVVVLFDWVCLAWVVAFTGQHFDTYERGAHSVIEQLSPARRSPTTGSAGGNRLRRLFGRVPELSIIVAFALLTLCHMLPGPSLIVAILFVAGGVFLRQRRPSGSGTPQPDYLAAAIGVMAFGACIAALRLWSENGSLSAFVLVVFVALASVRIGRGVGARLEAGAQGGTNPGGGEWIVEAFLLITPLLLLLPLASIDMGLVLVLVIPLGLATLLAAGIRRARGRLVVPAVAFTLLFIMGWTVVFPSMRPIREADSHAAQAEAFARMSTLMGTRLPFVSPSLDRAAARSVATRDQALAEALLVASGPGAARDLLIPSIEQIWGTKAYASAGAWGAGLGQAAIGGRGVAEAVSYAENTFSVFVLAEHGAVGGVLVLLLYGILTFAVAVLILDRSGATPSYRASRALFLVAALIIVIPACYVALSNLGLVPITGQNMPFLGLNAWSDVAVCAGIIGILITGTLRGLEEAKS